MAIVMQLWGDAFGGATPADGQYLKEFDFEAHGGQGEITMTPDIDEAMAFAGLAAAVEFRGRSPICRPLREDGEPNRPLTATTWQLVHRPEPRCDIADALAATLSAGQSSPATTEE